MIKASLSLVKPKEVKVKLDYKVKVGGQAPHPAVPQGGQPAHLNPLTPVPVNQFQHQMPAMQVLPEPITYIDRVRMIQQSTIDAGQLPPTNRPKVWDQVVQLPIFPPPGVGYIERGPADNIQVFGQLAGGGNNLLPCILRHLNIHPFLRVNVDNNAIDFDGLLVAAHICALRIEPILQRRQQLILEMIAPWIPEDQVMDQVASANEVGRLVADAQRMRLEMWFVEGIRHLQYAHPMGAGVVPEAPHDGQPGNLVHISHIWNLVGGDWIRNVTLQQVLEVFVEIVRAMNVQDRNRGLYPIVLMMVSLSVQGQMTPAKLARIIAELANDFQGIVESLNQPEIAATWRNFGQYINDGNVAEVIRRWINQVPQGAIGMRITLAQAAGSGLTQLDTIARARNEHLNFPWVNFVRFYRNEWEAAARAMRLVGNNPYFGFRRELREVRSTQYRYLAWACAQILIQGGDRALDNYRGFVEDRAHRDAVMDLIRGYYAIQSQPDLDRPVTREEYEYIEGTTDLIREYAGGMAGRADMMGHVNNLGLGDQGGQGRPGDQGRGGGGAGQMIGVNILHQAGQAQGIQQQPGLAPQPDGGPAGPAPIVILRPAPVPAAQAVPVVPPAQPVVAPLLAVPLQPQPAPVVVIAPAQQRDGGLAQGVPRDGAGLPPLALPLIPPPPPPRGLQGDGAGPPAQG